MNDSTNPTPLTQQRILQTLCDGTITEEVGVMRWSSNYTFLLSITHDDTQILAVYKPQRGERPLWDFPQGTLCYREAASYETSQILGWQIVPPTVLREGPHGIGSMQYFVEHDPELTYFNFPPEIRPQLQRIALFDYLVNNADRKGGHCLLDTTGHLWGIDHGLTFNTEHKLRTVIWDFTGQPIPHNLLQDLQTLHAQLQPTAPYYQKLSSLLSPEEIEMLQVRLNHITQTAEYPQPGSGPNYPWPPV